MVCTIGDGRMAAMVRLLKIESSPEITAEEANLEKIARQKIHKEFHDADEENLLEEEDMHVFDSRPLTDPLHLVCCNACKKPVKASQYAAHAERCVPLNFKEEPKKEFNSNGKHKKPPRKGREKLQAADHKCTTVGELENCHPLDANGIADSQSKLDGGSGLISSPSGVPKDAPIPLATKIYHLQGNRRLRLALGDLYRQASVKEHGGYSLSANLVKDKDLLPSQITSHKTDVSQKKEGTYSSTSVPNPDQKIAQSLEPCSKISKGLASTISSSNYLQENSIQRLGLPAATTTIGLMRTRYRSAIY
ncbi:hypothetical protein IHE45_06G019900 [Dioscorea alata]|uniref:Uncharacterized protein n=3 Tax=Dioscorea alata TaxID=55571 RepID=A0ACB7VVM8_DIOAL|nr:hypothetical protein IHE45_06G019900 [Dioscorea alata]KAH7678788.1 hypothetical protein IHE45_06G019900 [Dioscorea alata]KAH7678791.1 hypothetical protein IHE45_06G019900 [Dioscorea alata]